MLPGFPNTAPLTIDEERLARIIASGLLKRVGKNRSITSSEIIEKMNKAFGCNLAGSTLRKIIHHIRVNNLVPWLIATASGYYVAESEKELLDYIYSLRGRENAIKEVRECLERQL